MKKTSLITEALVIILRTALPVALLMAGWSVYRKLPPSDQTEARAGSETTLQIVLRPPPGFHGPLDVAVDLYPIDVSAAQREFLSKPHAGAKFEDFLKRRMEGRTAVKGRLDKTGKATLNVGEGNWWVVTQLTSDNQIEWRLPINVMGRKQSVELTTENAYGRSKMF